ncbi:Dehydrogenase/reductase SDR family member 7 [Seminavis robusta]|uniref:Dehydrogenase/reductase SDR family member 7 n=1 Tax=Seminavis robusta TaxID=568900 RepID=A0A9N8EIF9_9STRA|nr:Dehydrogenase/reductase SDR family member 7 [Seminavis robusta]|eukprot:Sro1152_g246840.1 Dehydrogenase/reductase SDR family member 7 (376) ;mRNA; f:6061-7188
MIPYNLLLRNSLTAAACAAVAAFGFMDANPSLYCYHQFLQWRGTASQGAYHDHFANKTVWIVGASSGIGEELAYQISPYCQKLILSSRNGEQLRKVAQACQTCPVAVIPLDVTSTPQELERLILEQLIPELCNNPDDENNANSLCVIFNAGQGHLSTVQETDPATTLRMFQVNTIPPIVLTQLLLQHKILAPGKTNKDKPQIVLTSSVAGRMGVPLSASYAASKHALHGYASSLQAECSSWLRVDILCPGPIDTPFFQNQPDKRNQQQTQQQQQTTDDTTTKTKKSPFKMSVQRMASLAMSHMAQKRQQGQEAWIAKQPTLLGMYLQQYVPGLWQWALNQKVGPKRVSLYQRGLDLYDPSSWNNDAGGDSDKKQQ